MGLRATGANAQLLAAWETTPGAKPAANWRKLPFVELDVGAVQPLESSDVLGRGREPDAPGRGPITDDGTLTVPVDVRDFGFWLKGLLGAPATAGGVHTFTSGKTSVPTLALDIGFTDVGDFFTHTLCVVDSLKIGWNPTQGRVNATVGVLAQQEAKTAAAASDTPTEAEFLRFSNFQGEIKRGAAVLGNVGEAEITIANNVEGVRVVRRDGVIAGVDLGIMSAVGKIVARYESDSLAAAAADGTAIALGLAFELDAATYLRFSLPAVHLPKPKLSIKGPAGVEVTYDFQASRPAGGATPFVTVQLANDVVSY